jgi:hypothetical protein
MESSEQAKDASFNATQTDDDSKDFSVTAWLDRITKARNKEQTWRERAKKCVRIYRDDGEGSDMSSGSGAHISGEYSFNILFANTETLLPALFSAPPKPDVRNRYLMQDKDAESAGDVVERSLVYSMDSYGFTRIIKGIVKDYLLTGRGTARSRLVPKFETQSNPVTDEIGQPIFDEMGQPIETEEEVLVGQQVLCEGVEWDSIVLEPCKKWEDVSWIAFIHMLSKEEFVEYFPKAPLIQATKQTTEFSPDPRYKVYEIWDKSKKQVYFIGQAENPLKIMEDPLKLTNFWPIPAPLYSVSTSGTLVPIPEYTLYQSQAEELNKISYRITDLIRACKFSGIYDAGEPKIGEIFESNDSEFVAVTSNRMREGGSKSLIDVIDTSSLSQVLGQLYAQREQVKAIIYEITGISDIIRGDTRASETATAQSIKASYAGLRLRDRRDNINTFIVELLRIQTEMICEFFTTEQLQQMSGVTITPEIEQILRSDILRNYKIDIETDSTILPDMQAETQQRAQLVSSITQYLTAVTPLVVQGLLPLETAKALMMFGIQPAKISRQLEDALEMIGKAPPPMPPQMGGMPGMMPPMGGMQPGVPEQMPPSAGMPQGLPPELAGLQMPQ